MPRKMTSQRISQMLRHPDAATLILGLVIALACAHLYSAAVGCSFWTGPSDLMTRSPPCGLRSQWGLTTGIGGSVIFAILNNVFGSASTWLPMLAFFPIATVGRGASPAVTMVALCGGNAVRGQSVRLQSSLRRSLRSPHRLRPLALRRQSCHSLAFIAGLRWCVPALCGGLTSLSPHFAWIYGLVVLGVAIVAVSTKQHPLRRVTGWFATCVGAFALMSTYIILPNGSTNLSTQIDRSVSIFIGPMAIHIWGSSQTCWPCTVSGELARPNSPKTSSSDGRSLCSRFS